MRSLVVLLVLSRVAIAVAGDGVGVVVSGKTLTNPVQNEVEQWLKSHGQQVVASPLPTDAVKTLLNCFVLDDTKCSRGVVESRATTESVVSMRIDVTSKKTREVLVMADWIVKGHNGVSLRRTCEDCTENALRQTIDEMMGELAKQSPGFTGSIKVSSKPLGMSVVIDNAVVGVTPFEHDLSVGPHKIALTQDGRTGETKQITIEPGSTIEITPPAPPPAPAQKVKIIEKNNPAIIRVEKRSRVLPTFSIALGVAALGTAAVFYTLSGNGYEENGSRPQWRDFKTPAPYVAVGGGVLVLTGIILMLRGGGGSSSAPTVGMTRDSTSLGWAGRF